MHQPDVIITHSSVDSWLVALATAVIWKNRPAMYWPGMYQRQFAQYDQSMAYTRSCDHCCQHGENQLRETFISGKNGFLPLHITSVRTGIDLSRFQAWATSWGPARIGIEWRRCDYCIVATLRSWKGHSYLLDRTLRSCACDAEFWNC